VTKITWRSCAEPWDTCFAQGSVIVLRVGESMDVGAFIDASYEVHRPAARATQDVQLWWDSEGQRGRSSSARTAFSIKTLNVENEIKIYSSSRARTQRLRKTAQSLETTSPPISPWSRKSTTLNNCLEVCGLLADCPTTNKLITINQHRQQLVYMAIMDVTAAFLEGTSDCRMFARLPKSIDPDESHIESIGNWYGLKQRPKIWNDQLNAILITLGFTCWTCS
jgi:hypothetical protein